MKIENAVAPSDGGGVARGRIDLAGTAGQQFIRKCVADASVCARDVQPQGVNPMLGIVNKPEEVAAAAALASDVTGD